jgi:hypothetical protein
LNEKNEENSKKKNNFGKKFQIQKNQIKIQKTQKNSKKLK